MQLAGPAPVYDMLPMAWAPIASQLVDRPMTSFQPAPVDEDLRDDVVAAVRRFWERVAADVFISDDLRWVANAKLARA